MKTKMRPRYYCDHCRKSGGSAHHMKRHEARCTANPERVCGMCQAGERTQQPLAVLLEAAELDEKASVIGEFDIAEPCATTHLTKAADGCPACMLAAIRVNGGYFDFDFKDECKKFWEIVNDANDVGVSGGDGD